MSNPLGASLVLLAAIALAILHPSGIKEALRTQHSHGASAGDQVRQLPVNPRGHQFPAGRSSGPRY
jgi:hypothetical protein